MTFPYIFLVSSAYICMSIHSYFPATHNSFLCMSLVYVIIMIISPSHNTPYRNLDQTTVFNSSWFMLHLISSLFICYFLISILFLVFQYLVSCEMKKQYHVACSYSRPAAYFTEIINSLFATFLLSANMTSPCCFDIKFF